MSDPSLETRGATTGSLAGRLQDAIRQSPHVWRAIERLPAIGLPNAYVAAGCLAQTVWNVALGNDLSHGLKDIDVIYYDPDVSAEREQQEILRVRKALGDLPFHIDVANEARVHLWYRQAFGYDIAPYASVEDAIGTFPTTATAIGVRLTGEGLRVHAPFGLQDLFALTIRPNKRQITKAIYNAKVERWRQTWPQLTFIEW